MTNETFLLMSDEEKNRKFKTVLKTKTGNLLTDEELNIIISNIPLKKQFAVRIYNDPVEFQTRLMLSDGSDSKTILGSMIAGADNSICRLFDFGKAAAVITKDNSSQGVNSIHIYIPLCKEAKMA